MLFVTEYVTKSVLIGWFWPSEFDAVRCPRTEQMADGDMVVDERLGGPLRN